MSPAVREADVIVVGAGLSGLIAARTLIAAGLQPLVLEADDRVGGRILTEEVAPGLPVEIGAQWIGDTHRRMFALAAELFFSLLLGWYDYQFGNVPAFVPPGHVLLFIDRKSVV